MGMDHCVSELLRLPSGAAGHGGAYHFELEVKVPAWHQLWLASLGAHDLSPAGQNQQAASFVYSDC